ncbi:calcium-binding protein [Rhodocyclaceae bacterium SMB388]
MPGWERLDIPPLENPTGFQGVAFVKTATGEVVVASRGTEILGADGDVQADIQMAKGELPYQYIYAKRFLNTVRAANPGAQITLTGHSLGGSLTQLLAAETGFQAVTFNAFGTKELIAGLNDLYRLDIDPNGDFDHITNHRTGFDPFSIAPGTSHLGAVETHVVPSEVAAAAAVLLASRFPFLSAAGIGTLGWWSHSIDRFTNEAMPLPGHSVSDLFAAEFLEFAFGVGATIDGIPDAIGNLFNSAQAAILRRDPLTLDLDGDGLETIGIDAANPVFFDHNGDGVRTASGWVLPDDGFLVLDRNGNGTIDDGTELFGDSTPLHDETGAVIGRAVDGFDALAQQDTNGDGVVDVEDANWSALRVWRDLNQDGVSQADELFTLDELGIVALSVDKRANRTPLANGNLIADLGTFTRLDGSSGTLGEVTAEMGDIDLIEDTFRSRFTDAIPLTEVTAILPDMNGSGAVRGLREAATLSPDLAALLQAYSVADTRAEQMALLDQLIVEWGRTSELAVTGDGAYGGRPTTVNIAGVVAGSDAFDVWMDRLQTLERFSGRAFGVPAADAPQVAVDLFAERRHLLDQAWNALRTSVYDALLLQTRLQPYVATLSLSITDAGIQFSFDGMHAAFEARFADAPGEAVRDLLDLQRLVGTRLAGLGWDGHGQLRDWLALAVDDPHLLPGIVAALSDFGYSGLRVDGAGTPRSDVVIGADVGATLSGGAGHDLVLGGPGDDVLHGGAGDDILYGGEGDDTYVFRLGDGADIIVETHGDAGEDGLRFGPGINPSDLAIVVEADRLVFVHANGRDRIAIANWFHTMAEDAYRLDTVGFDDGRSFALDAIQWAGDAGETLEGQTASNILVGGAGDDVLIGGDGNDWLDGRGGADVMSGGDGDDTYIVDDPDDVVVEHADGGIDTVESRISWTLGEHVENLRLVGTASISGTGNAFDNVIVGNAGHNTLLGLAGDDTLIGGDGNDVLDGGPGRDRMIGGRGNDFYHVDDRGDVVVERAGEGIDTVFSTISYALPDHVEHLHLIGDGARNGTGNDLDNTIIGNGASNRLYGGAGNDTLDGAAAADFMYGGTGDDIYIVDNPGDKVIEFEGEGVDTVRSTVSFKLPEHVENLTLLGAEHLEGRGNELDNIMVGNDGNNRLHGGDGNDVLRGGAGDDQLYGGDGDDVLDGGIGNDHLEGGRGNDTYLFGRGSGQDTILDHDLTPGNVDVLKFAAGVTADQLWFARNGSDLEVSIVGTPDSVTVMNWYADDAYRIEQIRTHDGGLLEDGQVDALVSAMAAFAPPAAGQSSLPAHYRETLDPVIAASWQ